MIKKMLFAGLLFLDTTAPRQECSALQLKQRRTPIIKATMLQFYAACPLLVTEVTDSLVKRDL